MPDVVLGSVHVAICWVAGEMKAERWPPEDWRSILDFEREWWKGAGPKEIQVRERFAISATRYYQRLNRLIDQEEALEYDPMLVRRLRRVREARRKKRFARRLDLG